MAVTGPWSPLQSLHSLRARLFAFLAALAALTSLAVGAATYFSVRAEADELFDYHLRQMALSLRDHGGTAVDEAAPPASPDFDYVVQIWTLDGVSLYASRPQGVIEPLPSRAVLGFSQVRIGGDTWRVYAAATPLRVVQVGQPLQARRRLAAAAAWRSVLPFAAAAPLVAIGLWWLVGVSLAPLQRVAAAAATRDAGSLEPLPVDGLPTELRPLVAAFNALMARLAAAFDLQRAFVADAAHELRTPLTALRLQIGLLADDDEASRAASLARLRGGVDRATHLVEQLLALARAEPGRDVPAQPLDLVEVARQALADVAPLAANRGARLAAELPASLPMRGDAQALRSLVGNLLSNAIRHAGPSPAVRLALGTEDDAPVLTVDDDGPGIPPAERERVFDRFHRREGSDSQGSGLGLAIVRAVAALHGGRVELGESPLGGLRARVDFAAPGQPG